jgi:hypothetical protein
VKPQRKRVRVQAYVEPELAQRIAERVKTTGATESGVVRSSLLQYLDSESDAMLVLRRLDRLGRALARQHRDVEFHSEAFSVFVRSWLAQAPTLDDDRQSAPGTPAEGRYRRFVEGVVEQFSGGSRFLDDLPQEPVASDTELDAIRGKTDEERPR